MISTLVIADDLTGANSVAAGLVADNLRTIVIAHDALGQGMDSRFDDYDALVVCTGSRHSTAQEIDDRLESVLSITHLPDIVSLRVDSTLRGSIAQATQTTLQLLERRSGRHTVALFMPAHPAAGRITIGAEQRIVEPSNSAVQPLSDVREVISLGTTLTGHHIPLSVVEGDSSELEARVRTAYATGSRIVIGDATTTSHLAAMCTAAMRACRELGYTLCLVDPGPATVEMVRVMGLSGVPKPPVLAVSGSVTPLTRRQMGRLAQLPGTKVVRSQGLISGDWDRDQRSLRDALVSGARTVVLLTALDATDVLPLTNEQASLVSAQLGRLVRNALEESRVSGLYLTGGDLAQAVLAALDGEGIVVVGEISPLTSFGYLSGGPWTGTPIVSKGGLVGDDDAAIASINHLITMAHAAVATTTRVAPDEAAKRGTKQ